MNPSGEQGMPSASLRRGNLPAQPTRLIGRDGDVAALAARLLGGQRLVTLVGPGGVGKTRLAIATASVIEAGGVDARARFGCGAWLVELAAHATAESAASAIRAVIEGAGAPRGADAAPAIGDAAARIAEWLCGRGVLLVLDNLEQMDDAPAIVDALLAAAPRLTVLATSRAPLGAAGEVVQVVAPLATPPPGARDPGLIAAAPAVSLYLDRVRATDPAFRFEAAHAAQVAAICRRLDGLPLAIELAAARAGLLPPAAMLARLGERLTLLASGPRDLPDRHHSIEAAVAWSDDLLAPDDRAIFHRLSVFRSPWTAESAAAVAGARTDDLRRLAHFSLLRRDEDPGGGEPRYRMLETVRAFAAERLAADPAARSAAQDAHARWFEELAAIHENRAAAVNRGGIFDRALDDLLAAIAWRDASGHPETGLLTAIRLGWYWYLRGRLSLGARLLAGVEDETGLPAPERARGLALLGLLRMSRGDLAGASGSLDAAGRLFRDLGDDAGDLEVREHQADLAMQRGDLAAARAIRADLLARRRSGQAVLVASAMNNLAEVEQLDGADARALDLLTAALATCSTAHDPLTRGLIQGNFASLGAAMALAGDPAAPPLDAVADHLRQSLGFSVASGDAFGVLVGLLTAAILAVPVDPARAATLLGAAEAVSRRSGIVISGVEGQRRALLRAALAASLAADECDAAIVAGSNLEEDAAVLLALDLAGSETAASPAQGQHHRSCGNRVGRVH